MNAASPPSLSLPDSAAITRASNSNLALAFIALPPERRRAAITFYAFCRVIDDIADEPVRPIEEKQRQLAEWKRAVGEPFEGEPSMAAEVRAMIERYKIDAGLLKDIIRGCEMDLMPVRFATFEDLCLYCYRVASVVGLVSIEIFGYRNASAKRYAVELGYALQLTNILRDVSKDLANEGRIYLPQEDLDRFGVTADDLVKRKGGPHFRELMAFEAARAEDFFAKAAAELAPEDCRSMAAAEIMSRVYHRILRRMRRDGFRVFDKDYRLRKVEKAGIVLWVLLFGR